MRLVGTLSTESDARRFSDWLLTRKIKSQVEREDAGWAVWIIDEDQVQPGRQELKAFQENPSDPRYATAAAEADRLRAEQKSKPQPKVVDLRNRWLTPRGTQLLTAILAALCIVVALGTSFAQKQPEIVAKLKLSNVQGVPGEPITLSSSAHLAEVRRGEVWRLVTPVFLHMGFLHLLGNMLMLQAFGNQIEFRLGSARLAVLVLLIAVLSNLAQYEWTVLSHLASPIRFPNDTPGNFGGMSGVVYGLFGFLWVRGRVDPAAGLGVSDRLTMMMMLWFVLCAAGVIPNVANAAHAAGLIVGGLAGLYASKR